MNSASTPTASPAALPAASTALPQPRLILRLGGLGNREFGSHGSSGLQDNPAQLTAAAEGACEIVLVEIESVLGKLHTADQQRDCVAPPMERACCYWWQSRLGWLFGQADRWGRLRTDPRDSAVFSKSCPLVTVLTGGEPGGDAIIRATALSRHRLDVIEYQHFEVKPASPAPGSQNGVAGGGLGIGTIPVAGKRPEGRLPTRDEANTLAETARQRAYGFRAQSEALRHHSDILLAIWDPDREGKAGGTLESVLNALRERVPVIAIRLTGAAEADIMVLSRPEELHASPGGLEPWQPALATVLQNILSFPDPRVSGDRQASHCHQTSYHPRAAYAVFREGEPIAVPWPGELWKALKAYSHGQISLLQMLGRWLTAPQPQATASAKPHTGAKDTFAFHFGQAKSRGSIISGVFGDAHRGGIIASYLLAALAVLLALTGSVLHHIHAPDVCVAIVAGLEVSVILGMCALASVSKIEDWHEAYTDCRILTEALRIMEQLGPLGVHTPLPKLPAYLAGDPGQQQPQRLWCVWYFRALVREAPLRLTAPGSAPVGSPQFFQSIRTAMLEKWIGGQKIYHGDNFKAQLKLQHGAEKLTAWAFAVVVICAAVHLCSVIHTSWFKGHDSLGLQMITFILCVSGPAVIAALHGFLSQIETVRLRQNSESMGQLLQEKARSLAVLNLSTDTADAVWGLSSEALATANLMMEETAAWSLNYRNTDIHAG